MSAAGAASRLTVLADLGRVLELTEELPTASRLAEARSLVRRARAALRTSEGVIDAAWPPVQQTESR